MNDALAGSPSPLDAMEVFEHRGWQFLCSAEKLPDGQFHPVVRYRAPPSDAIRTLLFDRHRYQSPSEAITKARLLAANWLIERDGDGRGSE